MSNSTYRKKKLFLLGPYATFLQWLFEALILTALPVLMAGSMMAVVDLLTGGLLSHVSDTFSLVWAIGQACAIELLFFVSFMKVAQYVAQGKWGKVFGWFLVGALLAVPSFQAAVVYGQVHTFGITVSQAIAQLGISDMQWIVIRALAVVFVSALEGIAAYTSEGTQKSAAEIEADAERKARIARANAKLARARASAYIGVGKGAVGSLFNREDEEPDEEENDSDPKAESGTSDAPDDVPANSRKGKGKRIYSIGEARKLRKTRENGSVQAVVYAFLGKYPNAPLSQIMEATGVSKASASKYKKSYRERAG